MEDKVYLLHDVLIILTVSIMIVVLSRHLKLSPVLGYLVAGTFLGQYGYNILLNPDYASTIGEFGVVFLLFTIGLELTIERMIQMRLYVFGFGGLQLLLTTIALIFAIDYYFNFTMPITIVVGASLSLSSTAVVLQVLAESRRQASQVGRISLAVLLMQDLAVVPLLAALPIISQPHSDITKMLGIAALKALAVVIGITIIGRLFLKPLFTVVSSTQNNDIYVPTTFLLVLSAAAATERLGLSDAMGAFLAGLLIAETEYRNKVEHSITPFKSLLLGLFFMSIGMNIDLSFIVKNWQKVLFAATGLLMVKGVIIFFICKLFRFRWGAAVHAGLLLSQGGEFAFVLLELAMGQKVLLAADGQLLLVVVAITMAITPILSTLGMKLEDKFSLDQQLDNNQEFKGVGDLDKHVIIAGFGRVGRVVAYMLTREKINYIAVDSNNALVKKARNQGFPIYHGDPSHVDTLHSVGIKRANAIIFTIDDNASLRKAVKMISQTYKNIQIISRVDDYRHGLGLRKLGANVTVPSTIETGIQLGGASLQHLGISESEVISIKEQIRQNHYSLIEEMELFRGITHMHLDSEKAKGSNQS
jgi:CPA2 family monovalent cation:H+ antiporter-2